MRISEAIALGSTMIKPLRGTHLTSDRTAGCAWGMVNMAVPQEFSDLVCKAEARMIPVFPCACRPTCGCGCMATNLSSMIVHLFDNHVMGVGDMTLEQLIDWVRTVEPVSVAEPESAPTLPVEPEPETEPEEECEIQECVVRS